MKRTLDQTRRQTLHDEPAHPIKALEMRAAPLLVRSDEPVMPITTKDLKVPIALGVWYVNRVRPR
ncbi:hypothetical protein IMZ48_41605 [Candidatus Bathyarchaeota archaeon]|nr:hypothetical protein [Candidatus Bathyarchaeota archaeon]